MTKTNLTNNNDVALTEIGAEVEVAVGAEVEVEPDAIWICRTIWICRQLRIREGM